MHLITLGGLRLDGVDFGRRKPLLLLAYLAIEGPQVRRHAAELLWHDASEPMANLRVALSRLRSVDASLVVIEGKRISTSVPCDANDLLESLGRRSADRVASAYAGPFLDGVFQHDLGVEVEEWIYSTRDAIARRASEALLFLGEQQAAEGNHAAATDTAKRVLATTPLKTAEPELLTRLHTVLLACEAPQARAVAAEAADYGVTVLASVADAQAALRSTTPTGVRNNVKSIRTGFVGRQRELQDLRGLLERDTSRLVTILGGPGVGKSRLANQAAHECIELASHPDGVLFIDLDDLTNADQVGTRLADVLDIPVQGSLEALDQVKGAIGRRHMLLVLDNYEHLIDGASITSELLDACPHLWLLATSRERLHVSEERILPLRGLSYAKHADPSPSQDPPSDAARLFTLRAQRANNDFVLNPETSASIARLCALVEGLPLAIELAATWLRFMPIQELVEELAGSLDALEATTSDVPDRHRTLRAAFEHSWRLLNDRERDVLRQLAVFHGGFRRRAAFEVAGATMPMLARLVDKSLLRVRDTGRFDMHPLFLQFARERLGTDEALAGAALNRHGAHYLEFMLEIRYAILSGDTAARSMAAAEEEQANLRSAWTWCLSHASPEQLHDLTYLWFHFGEARARFTFAGERLTELVNYSSDEMYAPAVGAALGTYAWILFRTIGDPVGILAAASRGRALLEPVRAQAQSFWWGKYACYRMESIGHMMLGEVDEAISNIEEAAALCSDVLEGSRTGTQEFEFRAAGLAMALHVKAVIYSTFGNYHAAEGAFLEAEPILEGVASAWLPIQYQAHGLNQLHRGALDAAESLLRRGVEASEAFGNMTALGHNQRDLARVLLARGDVDAAEELCRRAEVTQRAGGEQWLASQLRAVQGWIALARGDVRLGRTMFREGLAAALGLQWFMQGVESLVGLAHAEAADGNFIEAGRLLGFVLAFPGTHPALRSRSTALVEELTHRPKAEVLQRALEEGRQSTPEAVAVFAMSA